MGTPPTPPQPMAALQLIAAFSARSALIGESVRRSQSNTNGMMSILGSLDDHCFSALEVRKQAIGMAYENIDKMLKSVEVILAQFDLTQQAESKILREPYEDLESYIKAMDQLRGVIQFFESNKSFTTSDGVVNLCNNLLVKSIPKLEEEFKQILTTYSKPVEPDRLFDGLGYGGKSSTANGFENQFKTLEADVYKPPTLIPPRILSVLHDLAEQLFHAGNEVQSLKLYREARASCLEQSLRKLGVERLGKDDVQGIQWDVLEAKIINWIRFMQIAIKLLFAEERKVCDQIFAIDSQRDQCFAEVTGNNVAMLLSFGDAIARSKRSPEKLFVLLDMYEIMLELQPEIEIIFKGQACSEMRESAFSLTKCLVQTAQETFGVFEETVEKDATQTIVLDGNVHPLTHYVINYVKYFFDYPTKSKLLFQELEIGGDSDSQLAAATMRIMHALQSNLDGKSKQYKDPALTHLFLMNNIHYMVMSMCRSKAKDLLGDDWVRRSQRIVQQNAYRYRWVAWSNIHECLSYGRGSELILTGTVKERSYSEVFFASIERSGSSGVSRETVKERFKSFNIQFEELHQRQSQWTVPDPVLRKSLRLAVAQVLLPAYRSFVTCFEWIVKKEKNPQKYIRYTQEDLDRMLGDFFEGKTWKQRKR